MMDYEGGDLTAVRCCLCQWAGLHAQPVCLQAVGDSLSGLAPLISDEKCIRGAIEIDSLYLHLYDCVQLWYTTQNSSDNFPYNHHSSDDVY